MKDLILMLLFGVLLGLARLFGADKTDGYYYEA